MRATKPVLGAITLAVLLGSTACGGGAVTLRPASGSTAPTSDTTISGRTTTGVVATPDGATGKDGSGAGFSVGPDGRVTVSDGAGGGWSAGPDGVTVNDGSGNGYTAGPGGVSVHGGSGGSTAAPSDPQLSAGASDVVVFCGQAARYGTANIAAARALSTHGSGDAEKFATALATTNDAVAHMRRTGPPALQPDLSTLASMTSEISAEFERTGRDLQRLVADGTANGITSAGQGAFDRVGAAATELCK